MPQQNQDGSWRLTPQEWAYYTQQDRTANFATSVFNHPKANRKSKELIKEVYPEMQIADYDLEMKLQQYIGENERKQNEASEQKRQQDAETERLQLRKEAQEKHHLTDDAMLEVEQLMREKYIGNYDVAASHFVASRPATSEATFDQQYWHHERQNGFADIARDPEAWARNELQNAYRREEQRTRAFR